MSLASVILALVTLQRLGELALSRSQHRAAAWRAAPSRSVPAHYPLIVLVHAGWLIALWIWGRNQDVNLGRASLPSWRCKACGCGSSPPLGPRWTTRIIVLPGAPLVASGPYRYLPHPNYAVVIGEIALLPLALASAACWH